MFSIGYLRTHRDLQITEIWGNIVSYNPCLELGQAFYLECDHAVRRWQTSPTNHDVVPWQNIDRPHQSIPY
jgi:hypothetical protein